MTMEIARDFLLPRQIKKMVCTAGTVSLEQVLLMFREYDEKTVMYHIYNLSRVHEIDFQEYRRKDDPNETDKPGSVLSSRIESRRADALQKNLSDAFWALAAIGNKNISGYWHNVLPAETQLIFQTSGRKGKVLHDVTVLPAWIEQAERTVGSWKRSKRFGIPESMEDCIDHIALVFQEETGVYAVQKAGFNRCFSMTDRAFHPAIKGLDL